MSAPASTETRVRPRNFLGVLAFLKAYPRQVTLSVALLLVIIAIDLTLPQIIGDTISGLR